MDWSSIVPLITGYEQVGVQVRLYLDSPTPKPRFDRQRGVRTALFHLFGGSEAASMLAWLARNRAWQVLRVPPAYTPERGVRAVLAASDWHCGEGSGTLRFARTRMIADGDHRRQLQREVRAIIGMVLENPVREGEFEELQLLEDVVNTAPFGAELVTAAEVVDAFFGRRA